MSSLARFMVHVKVRLTCLARFLIALAEKRLAEERRLAEEEKARQQRHHQEELQSTASDEGVIMLKGSSAEELEEREFTDMQRRDSEE